MRTRPIIMDVIDKLELPYTYEQLLGMINLSVVSNTRIVKISVTSTSPQEAMNVANQLARTAKVQLPKVMDAPSPTIAEDAVLPQVKSSPSLSRNVLIGALLCLLAVMAVLTVLYLQDDTLKTSEEVEKLIADIQKKMQKAAAELNFEAAAEYRDKMVELKQMLRDIENERT